MLTVRTLLRTLWGDAADLRKRRRETFAVRVGEVVGQQVAAQVKPVVERLDRHETLAQERWDVIQRQQVAQQEVTTEVLSVLTRHITDEEEAARLRGAAGSRSTLRGRAGGRSRRS